MVRYRLRPAPIVLNGVPSRKARYHRGPHAIAKPARHMGPQGPKEAPASTFSSSASSLKIRRVRKRGVRLISATDCAGLWRGVRRPAARRRKRMTLGRSGAANRLRCGVWSAAGLVNRYSAAPRSRCCAMCACWRPRPLRSTGRMASAPGTLPINCADPIQRSMPGFPGVREPATQQF